MLEMYKTRPMMTVFITGTTLVIACEILYEGYGLIFNSVRKPRKKQWPITNTDLSIIRSTSVKSQEDLLEERKPAKEWNTVLFFPDRFPENPDSTTKQLFNYFESAKISIHICMYLASHAVIAEVIKKKYMDGLLVQVVTDYDTYTAHNNYGVKLWKRTGKRFHLLNRNKLRPAARPQFMLHFKILFIGIDVRMKATGSFMHHKFAIIDEEALLTGSLNWTKQACKIVNRLQLIKYKCTMRYAVV